MTDLQRILDARQIERLDMVRSQIEARNVRRHEVLDAMRYVPREIFLDERTQREAYDDRALTVGYGQTISQPYIVAYMTEQLDPAAHHRILEVGTGTGYQTAVLARLVRQVDTIERIPALSERAAGTLRTLGMENVNRFVGDGTLGLADRAPFDRILVTAGATAIPPALIDQLTDEGVLVMPVGGADEQVIAKLRRIGERTVEERLLPCRFVKLVGCQGWSESKSG